MGLRPTRRSTYSTGYRCDKSAVGMGRCGQWQAIKCSSWREVQQGHTNVTSVAPSGNYTPSRSHYKTGSVAELVPVSISGDWKLLSGRGLLTLRNQARNEGKPGYLGSSYWTPGSGFAFCRRTLNPDRRGTTGIASQRSGVQGACWKEGPELEERDEPGNLGSADSDDKSPGPDNARLARRSNRSSFRGVQATHIMRRVAARTEYRLQNTTEKLDTASGWQPRWEGPDKYLGSGRGFRDP